jgi:hypothetical protein
LPPNKFSNAAKLGRCLERLGVCEGLIQACKDISLPIFISLSRECLEELSGVVKMGGHILRAAQESLKEEVASEEEKGRNKRFREEEKINEGEDEEGWGNGNRRGASEGLDFLAMAANAQEGRLGSSGGARRGENRQTIGMKECKKYANPYQIATKDIAGKKTICDV